jgi:hypothetical protein
VTEQNLLDDKEERVVALVEKLDPLGRLSLQAAVGFQSVKPDGFGI